MELKLKLGQVIDVFNALRGNPRLGIIGLGQYEFANSDIMWAIAKNINKLKPVAEDHDLTIDKITRNYGVDKPEPKQSDPNYNSYHENIGKAQEEMRKLKQKEVTVDIHQILEEKVRDAKNPKDEKIVVNANTLAPLLDTVLVDKITKG